jgi:hypothetical protein
MELPVLFVRIWKYLSTFQLMPIVLKNTKLEIQIDLPGEGYVAPRFDQTGKISSLSYRGIPLTTSELPQGNDPITNGSGFYNEFDIDEPSGFQEALVGEWFHKIGVGLLQKDSHQYKFGHDYKLKPADFEIDHQNDKVIIVCKGRIHNGYGYQLHKVIRLLKDGFRLEYRLENTGEKTLNTTEYVHNFIGIDQTPIGKDYFLILPGATDPRQFNENVNPGDKVQFRGNEAQFSGKHEDPFFFSHLFGSNAKSAHWKLVNTQYSIAISETGDFETSKVNLWGWQHVVSPELFINFCLKPGEFRTWSRSFLIEIMER